MTTTLNINEEQDLQEAWPQVVAEFEKVTGKKLDPNANFDAISQQIDLDIRKSQSRNGTRARKIIADVGRCLQQFGDIVAQATSVVFGPSTQCWNAISFVITAAQSYRGVFEGFEALMEYSLAFLKRLNFFLNQHKTGPYLDPHLRGPAYAILRHFLELLKSSHVLATRKREKFKLVLNIVLFNDDAGVSESLRQMEALVLTFTNSEIDQILVDVKGLARYMRESAEETQRRHGELKEYFERTEGLLEHSAEGIQNLGKRLDSRFSKDQLKAFLKKIRDALQLEETSESWSKRQYTICGNRTEGTALWLLQQDLAYRSWADTLSVHSNKVMVVRGESGFGKSYLFSQVITNLEERYPRNKTQDRTYVLYYYFGEAEKEDSLRRCLGAMIYQLASLDETGKFATAIVEACEQSAKIATASSLWDLFLATLQSTIQQGRCFLCIDGFATGEDRVPSDILASMAREASLPQSESKGCSLRILVTGTSSDISSIPFDDESLVNHYSLGPDPSSDADSDSSAGGVPEPFANQGDLMVVAQARVQELRNLKPEIGNMLTEGDIQAIVTGVKGHYENLESKLKQIGACSCYEDVQQVIARAGEGFRSTTQNTIKSLNKTLNPEAIAQLNELLRWMKGCRTWTKLDLLQSALVFTLGKTLFLRTMIRTRFSTLLTLDAQDVVTGPDGLRDILSSADLAESDAISIDRTAVLAEAEVELCRRFIRNACGSYDFERFRFDDFFNGHIGRQVSKIRLDSEEVLELTILQTCVRSLAERQDDKRFYALRRYAAVWFYEHLVTVLNNMETFDYEKNVLREIGTSFASLLYENVAIDAWWSDDDLATLRGDWLLGDEKFHETLWKFVRHRSVAQGYAGEDEAEAWLRDKAVSESNAYSLLLRVASRLAGRWFGRNLANDDNFAIAFAIVARANGRSHDGVSLPSIEEIDLFIKWAQENADLDISPTQWTFRRGATYIRSGFTEEGIAAILQAERDGYSDWALPLKLAEVYCERKDYAAALDYCRKFNALKDECGHNDEAYDDGSRESYDEAYHGRLLLREGECHKNLKRSQPAVDCYMAVLRHEDIYGDAHQEALCSMFEVWYEEKDYASVMGLLRSWRDDSEPGLYHWIMKILLLDSVHLCLLEAARSTASHQEVIEAYRMALQMSSVQSDTNVDVTKQVANQLRYVLGVMLFYGSTSDTDHYEALEIWEDLIVNQNDAMNSWSVSYDSARKLFRSLFEMATQTQMGPECKHTARLARLAAMEHDHIRVFRQCGKDPRLSLARIQYIQGRKEEAYLTLRERLRNAFDGWSGKDDDDEDKIRGRYACVAPSLTVVGDDINAIAAWQATKPKVNDRSSIQAATDDLSSEQAIAGADDDRLVSDRPLDHSTQSSTIETVPVEATIVNNHDQETQSNKREPYLDGFYCDGGCGDEFDVSSNSYVCRNCLDVQLCSKCHTKLKDGQLPPTVCDSSHDFLHVPTVNQDLWERMDADQMILGDELVSRDTWIDGLREKWNLQQEQIDIEKLEAGRKLKAARCIATFIVDWKRGQRKKVAMLSKVL